MAWRGVKLEELPLGAGFVRFLRWSSSLSFPFPSDLWLWLWLWLCITNVRVRGKELAEEDICVLCVV